MTRCIDQCKAASEDYEEKYRIFFGEQAGILAQELKEGSPCPVCGSVHHPHKAKISEGGVDEKTVEEAKKIRDEAERKRAAAQEKYQEVRAQFETEEKALFGERYSREDEKQAEDRLAEYESLLAQKRSNLKKLQDAYRKTAEERAGGKSGFTENGTGRAVRAGTGNVSSGDTKAAVCGSGGIPGGEKMDRRLEADERSSKDV